MGAFCSIQFQLDRAVKNVVPNINVDIFLSILLKSPWSFQCCCLDFIYKVRQTKVRTIEEKKQQKLQKTLFQVIKYNESVFSSLSARW